MSTEHKVFKKTSQNINAFSVFTRAFLAEYSKNHGRPYRGGFSQAMNDPVLKTNWDALSEAEREEWKEKAREEKRSTRAAYVADISAKDSHKTYSAEQPSPHSSTDTIVTKEQMLPVEEVPGNFQKRATSLPADDARFYEPHSAEDGGFGDVQCQQIQPMKNGSSGSLPETKVDRGENLDQFPSGWMITNTSNRDSNEITSTGGILADEEHARRHETLAEDLMGFVSDSSDIEVIEHKSCAQVVAAANETEDLQRHTGEKGMTENVTLTQAEDQQRQATTPQEKMTPTPACGPQQQGQVTSSEPTTPIQAGTLQLQQEQTAMAQEKIALTETGALQQQCQITNPQEMTPIQAGTSQQQQRQMATFQEKMTPVMAGGLQQQRQMTSSEEKKDLNDPVPIRAVEPQAQNRVQSLQFQQNAMDSFGQNTKREDRAENVQYQQDSGDMFSPTHLQSLGQQKQPGQYDVDMAQLLTGKIGWSQDFREHYIAQLRMPNGARGIGRGLQFLPHINALDRAVRNYLEN